MQKIFRYQVLPGLSDSSRFCLKEALILSILPPLSFIPVFFLVWVFWRTDIGLLKDNTLVSEPVIQEAFAYRVIGELVAAIVTFFVYFAGVFTLCFFVLRWLTMPLKHAEAILDAALSEDKVPQKKSSILNVDKEFETVIKNLVARLPAEPVELNHKYSNILTWLLLFIMTYGAVWMLYLGTDAFVSDIMQAIVDKVIGIANNSLVYGEVIEAQFEILEDTVFWVLPFLSFFLVWRLKKLIHMRDGVLRSLSTAIAQSSYPVQLRHDHYFHSLAQKVNAFAKKHSLML